VEDPQKNKKGEEIENRADGADTHHKASEHFYVPVARFYQHRFIHIVRGDGKLSKWEQIMGIRVDEWGIKRMKTRWGTCNFPTRRIWLNLELAKKAPSCLEYIIVHEMVHLLERHHNDRFTGYMDRFMPGWRTRREDLNRAPLSHEDWTY